MYTFRSVLRVFLCTALIGITIASGVVEGNGVLQEDKLADVGTNLIGKERVESGDTSWSVTADGESEPALNSTGNGGIREEAHGASNASESVYSSGGILDGNNGPSINSTGNGGIREEAKGESIASESGEIVDGEIRSTSDSEENGGKQEEAQGESYHTEIGGFAGFQASVGANETVGQTADHQNNTATGGHSEISSSNVGISVTDRAKENETVHSEETDKDTTAEDVGVRLILTEMIEVGNISEARRLSRVSGGPFPAHIPSYSGFFTVNPRFNSNLFFWFFPCEKDYENAPVILWLQGGPGESSLIGLFNEIGPVYIASDGTSLVENQNSWHKNHSLIFIDNPVGTGFSYTDDDEGYATNQTQISDELYSAMTQFFKLFPELQKNEFFLAGESYAGKYIPVFAHTIHTRNPEAKLKINLKGISVGGGFTDPINMIILSDFVYQLGLVDDQIRAEMHSIERHMIRCIQRGDMKKASSMMSEHLFVFGINTRFTYYYNMLNSAPPKTANLYGRFVERQDVRMRIHVGDATFSSIMYNVGTKVYNKLASEHMVSVKPVLEKLLELYQVLYYSGQLDITVPYLMSLDMYNSLNWTKAEEYKRAERTHWYVDGELAGYKKSAGKFTEVLVRNAGHMVPQDQPVWARDLIICFTSGQLTSDRL